jgi:hypothetical protein
VTLSFWLAVTALTVLLGSEEVTLSVGLGISLSMVAAVLGERYAQALSLDLFWRYNENHIKVSVLDFLDSVSEIVLFHLILLLRSKKRRKNPVILISKSLPFYVLH